MTEEKLEVSRPLLILGNLALLGWIFLAFFSVFFYNPLYGWIYLVALAFIIYAILRRLGCNSVTGARRARAVLEGWQAHSSERVR